MLRGLRNWAGRLKGEIIALWLASRDRRTPWYAKALAVVVVGYALSPIDLIPDFIPILGYLDDLVLLPIGIYLVLRLIPPGLMEEHRRAAAGIAERPVSRRAAAVVIGLWLMAAAVTLWLIIAL